MPALTKHPSGLSERRIYTVGALNRAARALLEGNLGLVWVEGEISNLARPASGHLYFSLKDATAQLRCALFRGNGGRLTFTPEDGMHVLARGRVSLYETRGDYQLIVEYLEPAGTGALQRAFEELKQRLDKEGLFAVEHKRPLPILPRKIGIVTSPTGAAIRDILTVLGRRFPVAEAIIYPVQVQGEKAAEEIAASIHLAGERAETDVLIVARGGGSLEDLWAFNKEIVARAIYACPIPVVSGIGHEIDFTIADFVADQRAPTPSGAAELITPDRGEWMRNIASMAQRLETVMRQRLLTQRDKLAWCTRRLEQLHPGQRLRERTQRLDELDNRLRFLLRNLLRSKSAELETLTTGLLSHNPRTRLTRFADQLSNLCLRLVSAWRYRLDACNNRLTTAMRALDTVSPLATLERGYAIVTEPRSRKVITTTNQTSPGNTVDVRLFQGELVARIEQVKKEKE